MAAFVVAKVQTGQHNARCAALAGYRGSAATLKATGYRLAHDPRVQAALHEQCALAIKSSAATAVRVIEDVASDPRAEPKDRLRAAAMILDRSGLSAVTQHQITVDHRSEQDKVDLIVELAARLGIDPRQLLGQAGVAIDAEFKLIEPPGASTATQAERLTR
jgi:phage terminase small subunit